MANSQFMTTKVSTIHSIKKGSYIIIDGAPCRVVDIKMSAPGKHGHAKARIQAVGIIDNRKREIIKPSDAKIEVPIIEKKDAQVISINNNIAQVMDLETYETFELEIPEELRDKVKENCQVMYWDVLGTKMMKQVRG